MDFEKLLDVGLSYRYISHETFKSCKLEDFLNWLNKEKGLFHGSGTLISHDEKLISRRRIFHATDDGGVAIIKALFPNNLSDQTNLDYKLDKGNFQEVVIEGNPKGEIMRYKGYIYILENTGFSNEGTQGVAEYTKPLPLGKKQNYLFLIEVKKSDFSYSYRIIEK